MKGRENHKKKKN